MNRDEISTQIEKFVVEELMLKNKGFKLDHNLSLIHEAVIDSIGLLRLIAFFEEKFGVVVEDDELIPEKFDTIDEMTEFILAKL
jgi:acyl carrier protein